MAMVASPNGDYIAKAPPPPPPAVQKTTYSSYNDLLDGIVLLLRAAAALLAFVAVALVASCRHGDWMEFAHYLEYRYLLGATVVAFLYSAAQALRHFRRMHRGSNAYAASFLDFAGDQVVAYLLITASSAALPITIRMRSAVLNVFTDAIAASISLGFLAFAALAFSATLSGYRLSTACRAITISASTSLSLGTTAAGAMSTSVGNLQQPSTPPIAQLVTIKLKRENYLLWKAQMLPCLMSYNLMGYVDGSKAPPPRVVTVTATTEGDETYWHGSSPVLWF